MKCETVLVIWFVVMMRMLKYDGINKFSGYALKNFLITTVKDRQIVC